MSSWPSERVALPRRRESADVSRALVVAALAAGAVVAAGVVLSPGRAWPNVLLAAMYALGLALGSMLFLAFHYLTGAGWSVCLKRVAEAVASTLPLGAALALAAVAGTGTLYEWSHAEVVAGDPILRHKAAWLDLPFFAGRAVLYLAVWLLFCRAMLLVSRRQDSTGGLAANRRSTVLAAAFIPAYIVTFSLASIDWLMSLEPHWYSTVFAAYNFAGSFVSALAAITTAAIVLRRSGPLAGIVNEHHLHDLGKLTLGFCTFWAYLWFSQYLLIWYGNLPEEVTYYVHRHTGAWAVLSAANLLANWAVPFLVLLPRPAKTEESTLLRVCALLLAGRWLDLYLMIQPVFEPEAPVLGIQEIAPLGLLAAAFVLLLRRGLGAADLVPRGDPYLEESLHHHS
jgi:hypothetical protein